MPCFSPIKGYKCPVSGGLTFENRGVKLDVPCGKCIGCRMDYALVWAVRMTHEASMHLHNSFVTLTYRDKRDCTVKQREDFLHVPSDWSLNKKHFQDFMKRLRKRKGKCRYFHSGEYGRKCRHRIDLSLVACPMGCVLGRPHYHAALFGMSFDDLVSYKSDYGVLRYTSPELEDIWGYGFVDVGELNFTTAAYIARYILKKRSMSEEFHHYVGYDEEGNMVFLQKEYSTQSRKPGIGATWFEEFFSDVFPADEVPVTGKGVVNKVPRFYEEMYKKMFPEELEKVKQRRIEYKKKFAQEYTAERLEVKAAMRIAEGKLRKRSL